MRLILLCLSLWLTASPLAAQDSLGLSAPDDVTETGLLKHILPRFSLKTSIRVRPNPDGPMILADRPPGTAVFQRAGTVYYLRIDESKRQIRFRDWLLSEIGKRTVNNFQPDGQPLFDANVSVAAVETGPAFEGDLALGAKLSLELCGRCHVIGQQNRGKGIGSTPSFAVLRSLSNWDERFQSFFVLRPHGAFTQIKDVTEPFDPQRPSPISPIEMSIEDLDAILAYVSATQAADLGAPLQTQ